MEWPDEQISQFCLKHFLPITFFVKALPPPDRVLDLELQPCPALLVLLRCVVVHLVLVRLSIKGPRFNREEVWQFHKVNFFAQVCLDFGNLRQV